MENSEDLNQAGFDALVKAMKRPSRPLALLGAGTSVDSGYPDWAGLLQQLRVRAAVKAGNKYQAFLDRLNDPAWQAEEYRRLLGEHDFCRFIASQFAPRPEIGRALQAIVRLKFRHILTTNYDSTIELALEAAGERFEVADWTDSSKLRQFLLNLSQSDTTLFLVYLHGRFFDPTNVILTESSYASRYMRSDDAQRKLFAILITQPVVFIGFSVNDPDLNHLMREANARLGAGDPHHFALMGYEAKEERELIKNRFNAKYGIQPVFYRIKVSGGKQDHGELVSLLGRLYTAVFNSYWQPLSPLLRVELPVEEASRPPDPRALEVSASGEALPWVADSLDQQKGRWGGAAENQERRLRVENIKAVRHDWCSFDLVVEATENAATTLTGAVTFHLHQTFHPDTVIENVEDGRARLARVAYGAFTVGAEADGGATKLELDLAEVLDFPDWFRMR